MSLNPDYRCVINKNLVQFPMFFEFLKQEYNKDLLDRVRALKISDDLVYKFVVYSVPPGGAQIVQQIKLMENGLIPETPKLQKIAEILQQLNPMEQHEPVVLEFTLWQIISYVMNHLIHFQEYQQGTGLIDYFGIDLSQWFDDYPILTGTVLRAVDFGTLENAPLHLFDVTFIDIRERLLDLFAIFINTQKEQEIERDQVENVDVQTV